MGSRRIVVPALCDVTARPPVVFIGVPMAAGVRDVLRSDVFKVLRDAGVQLHLFTRAGHVESFRREFEDGNDNVRLHALAAAPTGGLRAAGFRLFDRLVHRFFLLVLARRTATGRIFARIRFSNRPMALALVGTAARAASWANGPVLALARWGARRWGPDLYGEQIRRLCPDLVVGTRVLTLTPNHGAASKPYADRYLVISAAKHGVPNMILVPSWDNLTCKGFFPVLPNRITVWNETMRREAVQVHELARETVCVTGAPQHDVYADAPYQTRRDLCAALRLDPAKPYLVYATQTEGTVPEEPRLALDIAKAVRANFGDSLSLLVRVHQLDRPERYDRLRDLPDVAVDVAGAAHLGEYRDRAFDRAASERLADTLHHAAVVASTASSISIDAAALGTPVVGVCFDAADSVLPYERSVRRFFDFSHQANLVRSGGLRLASEMSALMDAVERYVGDPSLDSDARRRLVEEQTLRIDGNAGRRVAAAVLEALPDE